MSATAEAPTRQRMTRDQAASRILEHLTEEPQAAAALRRAIIGTGTSRGSEDPIRAGLDVLEARRQAIRLPNQGWVLYRPELEQAPDQPLKVDFNYKWATVSVNDMFVDENYQRPVTSFVKRIKDRFDPLLFQTLALSDRGKNHLPQRYAIVDGQTRWRAAIDLQITDVPCVVYTGLTPQDEASIFAKLQKERRGMATWHRFRAALAANDEEALAIRKLAGAAGYEIGDKEGQIKAIAALEVSYRRDGIFLTRTLTVCKEAWPDFIPEDIHIRGIHRFFRDYPLDKRGTVKNVDDAKLVTRLKTAGAEGLKRRAMAIKEGGTVKGGNDLLMAHAIQAAYKR